MSGLQCKDCKFFVQHYGLNQKKLYEIYCGHCTAFRKSKNKTPDAPPCEKFQPGLCDREHFVSKEFLSKELLKYVLSLELLPEISDDKRE